MSKLFSLEDKKFTLGVMLVVANKINTWLDREIAEYDLTAKQWFLVKAIENLFNEAPTIKELGDVVGYSHQNVKQLALKLEEKGFVKLVKDKRDARATRLELTEKNYSFWKDTQEEGNNFMREIYEGITDEEMIFMRKILQRMWDNAQNKDKLKGE